MNLWINFVLYAVVGLTAQADALMRSHAAGVERTAAWLRQKQPFKMGPLYRGILVAPVKVEGGRLAHDPDLEFLSWSEDLDVACWFAATDAIISEVVVQMRPGVRGYVVKGKGDPQKVLWRHEWIAVPIPDGGELDLRAAALYHPDVDGAQFSWNVETQHEVITRAPSRPTRFRVEPVEKERCADVEELDARYTFPPFLEDRFGV